VSIRDLALHVPRRGRAHEVGEGADEREEDDDADDLERGVRRGDPPGFRVLPDRGEHGRRGRAHIRAEDDRDRSEQRHQTGGGEREREADHGRARPHERGEHGGDQDEQEGLVGESAEQIGEQLVRRERRRAVVDDLHSEEKEAEAEDRLPYVPHRAAAADVEDPSDEHHEG
jgi:hypothetical protein